MAGTLYISSRKGLFAVRKRGRSWSVGAPAFLGEPVSAVFADPRTGLLLAALRLGHFGVKLHRSEDGGKTWSETPAPAFPKTSDDPKHGPSVDTLWNFTAGGADQPGVIWCGTIPGGLFRSGDDGLTWALVETLWNRPERAKWMGVGGDQPGIGTVLVDPRDSNKLTLGISTGGVWKSDDGAKTWRQAGFGMRNEYLPPDKAGDPAMQDVHRIASPAADPRVVWCQHHNGIFRSADGGENFREIKKVKPSVFGFAVVAHPHDAKTAWFVPGVKDEKRVAVDGKLVVNRTSDGGKTFEPLNRGLPKVGCYDLIYRHALTVDDSGDRLAFGSTTGNLWISENGGKAWTQVSCYLPPIAAVNWG